MIVVVAVVIIVFGVLSVNAQPIPDRSVGLLLIAIGTGILVVVAKPLLERHHAEAFAAHSYVDAEDREDELDDDEDPGRSYS